MLFSAAFCCPLILDFYHMKTADKLITNTSDGTILLKLAEYYTLLLLTHALQRDGYGHVASRELLLLLSYLTDAI